MTGACSITLGLCAKLDALGYLLFPSKFWDRVIRYCAFPPNTALRHALWVELQVLIRFTGDSKGSGAGGAFSLTHGLVRHKMTIGLLAFPPFFRRFDSPHPNPLCFT